MNGQTGKEELEWGETKFERSLIRVLHSINLTLAMLAADLKRLADATRVAGIAVTPGKPVDRK